MTPSPRRARVHFKASYINLCRVPTASMAGPAATGTDETTGVKHRIVAIRSQIDLVYVEPKPACPSTLPAVIPVIRE
ncbi:hypothetical protein CC1G_14803 [Coprinopsis cinerea okayama7|uniref:Uncharacterized protein n=1 Tax=Coprinopsis cinerea (strain Okayama-7 / 130 / ATCC MYA-4618 / FGSC 9003) TaxID=240176 RepID=D6RNI3_COPC7|nr:hypothetical protein CC1G_14803 [Coprinopsis cinerea okayama7\|eukprot:XP_002910824.1 hypothetical protein CC1G_14803 [Coprinopsis cinerea okayama7\